MQPMTRETLPDKKDPQYHFTNLRKLTRDLMIAPYPVQTVTLQPGQIYHDAGVVDDAVCASRAQIIHVPAGVSACFVHVLAADACCIDQFEITLAEGAALKFIHLNLNGALVRASVDVKMSGPGASVSVYTAQILADDHHGDFTLSVHHQAPHTTSRQIVRSIVNDRARGVYQGKIIAEPGAQKTDAAQQIKAMVLANTAEMNTRPELEIYADDVQCAHGASIGALDPDQLFYLQARGVPEKNARALLLRTFIDEVCAQLPNELAARYTETIDQMMEKTR